MNLGDLVALAKAGYTPKQVKELIELADTSSKEKAEPEKKVEDKKAEPEPKKTENENKSEDEDPVTTLINILKEE